LESALSKLIVIASVWVALLGAAAGQNVDFAFGAGTVSAPSASSAGPNNLPESIAAGTYLNFSGDFLIRRHIGAQGEVAWRAGQAQYFGVQPYRPIFYDFNGIYAPPLGKHAGLELMAGIGAESLRFYTGTTVCTFTSCTNFVSTNHFMGHFGGGIKLYAHGRFFVRPEGHVYLVRNNQGFSSNHLTRFGVSIGYSLGGE
jgi:hypothetical protein